jgi:hypothetical protein
MRATDPMPGNPWPSDMVISIQSSDALTLLLFVRSAWHLSVPEVPELDSEPEVGTSVRPASIDPSAATERWRTEWAQAWKEYAPRGGIREPDATTQHLLDTLNDAELWDAVFPRPSQYWDDGLDRVALYEWQRSFIDYLHQLPLDEHPERRALPALIAAWRTGLTTIIDVPFGGYYANRLDRERLMVSVYTRRDTELYSRALATPLPDQSR